MPKASFKSGQMSLMTNNPNNPMMPHCSNIPVSAYDQIGPTRFATSFIETLGEERGRAPNTSAIKIAE